MWVDRATPGYSVEGIVCGRTDLCAQISPSALASPDFPGLGEFFRQLKYKAEWYGSKVVEADPFFPSTKRCSNCGNVRGEMPLSERVYECDVCGYEADRELNSARNLASVAASWAETQNACKSGEVHAARLPQGSSHGQVLHEEAGTEHRLGMF